MNKIPKDKAINILSIGTKILLKDVMDQYLRSLGDVKTFYASKLSVAVESYRDHRPQIVFCEQFFSEGGAIDFIAGIGGLDLAADRYFVLATESSSDELVALAVEQNIDEILVKPFSTEHIHQIVERYLEKREGQKTPWIEDLRAARSADQSKRFQEAEELYMALVGKHRGQIGVLLEAAEFFFHRLNYEACLNIIEEVLRSAPNNARALSLAGNAMKKMGRFREALDKLHKASSFSPLNVQRSLEIADIHILLADEQVTTASRLDMENTALLLQKAKLLFMRKDYLSAVQYLDVKRAFLTDAGKKEADALLAICKKMAGIK